ncbi:hypothetical protein M3Y95_00664500 [Aphelenchoides besseyi]|nr:hypothetical protein M3Y95_00664500 [Aphelenchoides besseyi]
MDKAKGRKPFRKTFDAEFEAYFQEEQKKNPTLNREDALAQFAVDTHYKEGETVVVIPNYTKSGFEVDGYSFSKRYNDNKYLLGYGDQFYNYNCPLTILVPRDAANGRRLGVLRNEHVHQRHANQAYTETGLLRAAVDLMAAADHLKSNGLDFESFDMTGEVGIPSDGFKTQKAIQLLQLARTQFRRHYVKSEELTGKPNSCTYVIMKRGFVRNSSNTAKLEEVGYVGERETTARARATVNRFNATALNMFPKKLGSPMKYTSIDLQNRLSENQRHQGETMVIGLFKGSAHNADYRLANVQRGREVGSQLSKNVKRPIYVGGTSAIDSLIASYLLLRGFELGGHHEIDYTPQSGLALKRHEEQQKKEKKQMAEHAELIALRERVANFSEQRAPSVKELIAKAEKAAEDAARPQSSAASAIAQERANRLAVTAEKASEIAELAAGLPTPKPAKTPSTVVEAPSTNSDVIAENARLRAEVEHLRAEVEQLKKRNSELEREEVKKAKFS